MDEEWKPDAKSKARVKQRLERIDAAHELLPVCPCGQRTKNPGGICSKKSEAHAALVAESRWK